MTVPFSFADHVLLLNHFLDQRKTIVEAIERELLNVRAKEMARRKDRQSFETTLTGCFFAVPRIPAELLQLKAQLNATHRRDGFEPLRVSQHAHELDPVELIARAHLHWDLGRWPGSTGRLAYARTIYAVFMLRQLELLSLRIWDDGTDRASDRLAEIQRLLDRLNDPSIAAPAFIRDARWLIQTAQGPLTRYLQPYFRIADRISESFTPSERLEVHKAGACLAGGHLRSQLRYRMSEPRRRVDDPELLATTRLSNSMDNALLVRDLVALLRAYRAACVAEDSETRLDLADTILQGLSADPELLLIRLDLLTPWTIVEDLFVERGNDGRARHTDMGEAHLELLEKYAHLIGESAAPLKEDASRLDPAQRVYSPFGITYGFCADLLSNIAIGTLHGRSSSGLALEDMFISRGNLDEKLSRAGAWEALPKREGEREHFYHSREWAGEIFARLVDALSARMRTSNPNASDVPNASIYVGVDAPDAAAANEFCVTTDLQRAVSSGATLLQKPQVLEDRNEARFLASAESNDHWFGVSKTILAILTGPGKDAVITRVPQNVVEVLRLTCPKHVRFSS